jgi:hypothetical protein
MTATPRPDAPAIQLTPEEHAAITRVFESGPSVFGALSTPHGPRLSQ